MAEHQTHNLMEDETPSYEEVTDQIALSRVVQSFAKYESWRDVNCDRRWVHLDQLYKGVVPQRYWEGTKVPRSSISVRLIHSQIQSVLPLLHQALFGHDVEWFQVQAIGSTPPQEAAAVQERLLYLCEHPTDHLGDSARNQITLCLPDFLIKGVGAIAIEMDPTTMEPMVHRVSPYDLYVDPGCGPDIEKAKSVIWRRTLTVDDIDALRDSEGFKIPSRDELMILAGKTPLPQSDNAKQMQEASRGMIFSPSTDGDGVFGAQRNLELLVYYTKSQVVWVINRQKVIYNGVNPYGFYPFAAASCFIEPDRFYGIGYAEILADIQKYVQSIRNARLDELSLALNPPRAVRRGADNETTFSQKILRPGAVQQFANPREDLVLQQPQNVTSESYQEEGFMLQQAKEYTGVNSMVLEGTPIRSNASSSATSVTAQREMPSLRLLMLVISLENYLVVPMLYKMLEMHRLHVEGEMQLRGIGADGEQTMVDNMALQNEVKFRVLGSTRMVAKDKLMQIFPFVTQYLLNPELMGMIQQTGNTVDMNEWLRMLQDATGTKQMYQLIRPISEEEREAMMQPTPEQVQDQQKTQAANDVKMQLADKRAQSQQATQQAKSQGEMQKEALRLIMSQMGRGNVQ